MLGAAMMSTYRGLEVVMPFGVAPIPNGYVEVDVSAGGVGVDVQVAEPLTALWFGFAELQAGLNVVPASFLGELSFSGWWMWRFEHYTDPGLASAGAYVPIWCMLLPMAALSALGFRARHRLAIPEGACTNCRHPLAGADVCPECGMKVQSSQPPSRGAGAPAR